MLKAILAAEHARKQRAEDLEASKQKVQEAKRKLLLEAAKQQRFTKGSSEEDIEEAITSSGSGSGSEDDTSAVPRFNSVSGANVKNIKKGGGGAAPRGAAFGALIVIQAARCGVHVREIRERGGVGIALLVKDLLAFTGVA